MTMQVVAFLTDSLACPEAIQDELGMTLVASSCPIYPVSEEAKLFRSLADEWRRKTAGLPRVKDRISHPLYLQIIDWGEDAVPHILSELMNREPDHWFEALSQITGANPVPLQSRGNVREMADAWVRWGRLHGWIN